MHRLRSRSITGTGVIPGASSALVLLCASLLLAPASPAFAAERDPDKLIEEGLDLREQHRDEEALARFQKAYEIKPTPRAIAQVALAEQALGRWLDAARDLDKALAADGDEWIKPRLPQLKQARALIDQHLAQLEVRCNIAGAELWVGPDRAAVLPMKGPLRVEAGTVSIQVRAPGYVPASRTVTLEGGRLTRESFKLVAEQAVPVFGTAGAPADARTAELRAVRATLRKVLYAGIGAGTTFYLPTLGFGIRTTVHPRVDVTARADLGLLFRYDSVNTSVLVNNVLTPMTLNYYRLGPALGIDGTVRFRPLSEASSWYVGAGLTVKFAIHVPVGDAASSTAVTGSSGVGFSVPFGGILESGLLLGKREQWDVGLRFEGGLDLLAGFLCAGYAI